MTVTHAHYIGITTPRCALTYGVSPCKAQLSTRSDGSIPNAVWPQDAYARRAAGLSGGIADGGMGLLSFWYFAFNNLSGNRTLFAGETALAGSTARFTARFVNNVLRIVGVNSSGTTVLDIRASSMPVDKWTHVLASWDLSTSGRRSIYVDDVLNVSQTTFTVGGSIDYTLSDWSFCALANGTEVFSNNCGYMDFYFKDATYLDLSNSANRRLFYSADNRPVYLGANGSTPTGSQPRVFFTNRVEDGWATNLGTGAGFGTIVNGGDENNVDFGTGSQKCFNTLATCQDPVDYSEDDPLQIMEFAEDVNVNTLGRFLDPDGPVFPFIKAIDFQSVIVSLGDNMGQRGQVTVTFRDAPHNDLPSSLFDKYASERDYDPYSTGTFWGKFRARNRFLRFQPLYLFTVKKNALGDDDEGTIDLRTYIIDSVTGPDQNGEFKIVAKDILKAVDGDYATAPGQSPGYLAADITDVATTATIAPSGILSEYDSSGLAVIGGTEIVTYTQTGGDNISLDSRGVFGTQASDHSAQDRFQIPYAVEPSSPDEIIADLLINYGGVDAATIDTAAWAAEVAANLGTVYSIIITEPTSVADLVSEIIQQIGGAIWWDDVNGQIRLQILRAIPTDADHFNEDNTIAQSFQVTEQESKRITQVAVYYAQFDPTRPRDEIRNYASVWTETDETTEILVGGRSIKTIFARGISSGGQAVAQRLAQKYLSRYVEPPRRFNFDLLKYSGVNPALGGGYLLGGGDLLSPNTLQSGTDLQGRWPLQDEFGNAVEVPIQVTRINPVGNTFSVEAEEVLFTAFGSDIDPTNHTVIFDVSRLDVNLQTVHDSLYQEALSGDTVNCYVNAGVIIGSSSIDSPAFDVGFFNSGVTVNLFVIGRIQGKGGDGGRAVTNAAGQHGGTALYTRQAINLDSSAGGIWGGGGGGGGSVNVLGSTILGAGGGGGAGTLSGAGGTVSSTYNYQYPGNSGSSEAGGTKTHAFAGNGGDPGQAGQSASGGNFSNGAGGAAGNYIDGNAFITHVADGDHRGGVS